MNKQLLFAILIFSVSTSSFAQMLYIKDVFYAPMRSGASNSHRVIHAGLPSGTKLEKIETQGEFTKVKTEAGKIGWLRSDYLTEKPIARELLNQAQQKIEILSQGQKPFLEKMETLEKQNLQQTQKIEQLNKINVSLQNELDRIKTVSEKPMEIDALNQQLIREKELTTNELDVLRAENAHLKNSQQRDTVINTLLAVILGVVLSIVLPILKPRKKPGDDWS